MAIETYWKETDSTNIEAEAAIHDGDGVILRRKFFRGVSRLAVNFDIWELAPGTSEGNHIHAGKDGLEEIYYFLQGQGVMWIEGQELAVSAGDAILVPPGIDHGMRTVGSEPLRLVLLFGEPRI